MVSFTGEDHRNDLPGSLAVFNHQYRFLVGFWGGCRLLGNFGLNPGVSCRWIFMPVGFKDIDRLSIELCTRGIPLGNMEETQRLLDLVEVEITERNTVRHLNIFRIKLWTRRYLANAVSSRSCCAGFPAEPSWIFSCERQLLQWKGLSTKTVQQNGQRLTVGGAVSSND